VPGQDDAFGDYAVEGGGEGCAGCDELEGRRGGGGGGEVEVFVAVFGGFGALEVEDWDGAPG